MHMVCKETLYLMLVLCDYNISLQSIQSTAKVSECTFSVIMGCCGSNAEYPEATLIRVTNIPNNCATVQDVKDLLKDCGDILETSQLMFLERNLESDQYVFVTFQTGEQANNALKIDNPKLNGNDVTIELVDTKKEREYIPKEMKYIHQKI